MKNPQNKIYWFGGWLYDFTKVVAILVFVLLIFHYFFFTVFIVKGESMEPNFHDGDIIFINRIGYRVNQPRIQDAIALYFPGEIEKKYIKRVVATPGQHVEIKNGSIFINNQRLTEPYIKNMLTSPDMNVQLDDDEYFVLGDNRPVSSDSRVWGSLPEKYVIGKAQKKLGNTHNISKLSTWINGIKGLF